MLKYIWRDKKQLIILIAILLVCSIAIAIGIYAQITNSKITKTEEEKQQANYEDLKNNFDSIFTNTINKEGSAKIENSNINYDDIIETKYKVNEKKETKYNIVAEIPLLKKETETTKKINEEILDIFGKKVVDIVKNNKTYTVYNLGYVGYINDNILSLAIKSTLKRGNNPQREIIQTYNYNLETGEKVELVDVLTKRNIVQSECQNKINQVVSKAQEEAQILVKSGYQVYNRDLSNSIYQLSNISNFFLGSTGELYIIFAYGNQNFTAEMDVVLYE